MKDIRPIIVIGINRTGTKWISNILCNADEVIGMQRDRKRSGGIMETNLFGNLQRVFYSLTRPDDFIGFVELWSSTDFFKQTGLEKGFLYAQPHRPHDCYEIFRLVMTELARRHNCSFWLQKTSPFQAPAVLEKYRDSIKIIIRRNIKDTIRSQIGVLRRNGMNGNILKRVFFYVLQEKILLHLEKSFDKNDAITTYEKLKADPTAETARICESIGIGYDPGMLNIPFAPNSSFPSPDQRDMVLSSFEEKNILIYAYILRLMPRWLMSFIRSTLSRGKQGVFVPGSFGSIKDKYGF